MKKRLPCLILLLSLLLGACQPAPVRATPPFPSQASGSPGGSPLPSTTDIPGGSPQTVRATLPFSSQASDIPGGSPLPFDEFVEESFRLLLLRDPETVTMEGLSGLLGVRDAQLNDLSEAYVQETFALQRAVYDLLRSYERADLTPAQQVTYDTYAWYLDDLLRGQGFHYNDYPVNFMYILGAQYVTQALFTDYQPLENLEDAQDYIARLSQVKNKFEQLIQSLYQRQQAGYSAPRFVWEWSLGDVQGIANTDAEDTAFFQTFNNKVDALHDLSTAEKDVLCDQALAAINDSVLPAYQSLAEAMQELMKDAPQEVGVWQFENGEAYYAYALRHFTSTEMSAEEIHQLGLSELERIHAEMRQRFTQLGYPEANSLAENYRLLAGDSGLLKGENILQRYEMLIEDANQKITPAFDIFPQAQVVMDHIPSGAAFYVSAAYDGSRPGVFYAPVGGQQPAYTLPTVAYHEAVPGHHFQIALQREMDLPLMRNVVGFNAYAEGWALYAERLVYELGWYADNPYGDLGRLQYEAHRAARLVVDTGIHAKRWSFEQALDFMVENTGLDRSFLQSEVARYIVWPGQACSYSIGYLKLLELRQKAQVQLGDAFDLVAFHHVVLSAGSVPLDVLEEVVEDWLAGK